MPTATGVAAWDQAVHSPGTGGRGQCGAGDKRCQGAMGAPGPEKNILAGVGVFTLDGRMDDAPELRLAERSVAQHIPD